MSTAANIRVACIGHVFIPKARPIIQAVAPAGFELLFAEQPGPETDKWLETSDFLFVSSPVDEDMILRAPKLRMIQKWGIGVDKIDLAAAERHGIYVAITAGANAATVSEHTVLLMLSVFRRLPLADRAMHEGRWITAQIRPQARKLLGKTVGILGFGNIGRAVARRLQGFETRILYHDIMGPFKEVERNLGATYVTKDQLLAESDILTLHSPGGGGNRHLIDRAAIGKMKPGAILINTARGDLVDEDALVDALASGHLSGAGLDVFEPEPLPTGSRLVEFDNVVMTPHAAGSVMDNVEPMAAHGLKNMLRLVQGEQLSAADLVVNPSRPRTAVVR
ncbi:MAG: 2-hydroxyacid dehydrogenase [Thermodesulfobacteriota bacterium]